MMCGEIKNQYACLILTQLIPVCIR